MSLTVEIDAKEEFISVDAYGDNNRVLFGNIQVNLTDEQIVELRDELTEWIEQ